jgi:hypothetical protein
VREWRYASRRAEVAAAVDESLHRTHVDLVRSKIRQAGLKTMQTRLLLHLSALICFVTASSAWQAAPQHNYLKRQVTPEIAAALKAVLAPTEDTPVPGWACDAVPLNSEAFIASVDYTGRGFCNAVLWIALGSPARVLRTFRAWAVVDLSDVVQDLDHDGVPEIVVPVSWSAYAGAYCTAIKFVIYHCVGEECSDVSKQFPSFYQNQRQTYEDRIALLSRVPDSPEARVLPCLLMQRDWISRRLSGDQRVGFALAQQWIARTDDPDENLREKAVAILQDIADTESVAQLKRLATGKDKQVAILASSALTVLAMKKPGGW